MKGRPYLLILCVLLSANGLYGQALDSETRWFSFSNQLSFQTEWYAARGIDDRQQPLTYVLHGNPTMYLKGTPVPFSFLFSNFSNQFQQPFNQFGMSPRYKWAQVHVGYRNLVYSPFTLAGQRMLGAGFDLNPGKFHISFFRGRIRHAIEPDDQFLLPTIPGGILFGPGYKRTAWAGKIGYGDLDRNYIALSFLRGADDPQSLAAQFAAEVPAPEVNTVIGLTWNLRFFKHIHWKSNLAISAYTRDRFSDTLAVDPFPLSNLVTSLFQPQIASQYLAAAESSLGYRGKRFDLSLMYRRIDPDYKSMGAYFFNADIEQWTLNPGVRIGRSLRLRGSLGTQRDNLYDLRQRTTRRLIFSGHGDWMANRWFSVSAQVANFGVTQNPIAPNIADTMLLRQVNTLWGIQPRVTLVQTGGTTQLIQLNIIHQALSNELSGSFAPVEVNTQNYALIYSWSLAARGLSLSPSLNMVSVDTEGQRNWSLGGGLNAGILLGKRRLPLEGQLSWFRNTSGPEVLGSTLVSGLRLGIPLRRGIAFQLGAQQLSNRSTSIQFPAFSEFRLRAGFSWSFSSESQK